jgi:hypothetical protein
VAVYRYRLADNDKNIDINSRVIEGFRLRKNAWLVSDDRLNFDSFSDFVEEQLADSIADFDRLDLEKEQAARDEIRIAKEPTPIDIKKNDSLLVTDSREKNNQLSVEDKLLHRGFSKAELQGRSEKDLEDLLLFDSSIPTKRG